MKFSRISKMVILAVLGGFAAAVSGDVPFVFSDAGDEAGLFPHVAGLHGHGAAWGDVDNNGWIDLYVATFAKKEAKTNRLFLNNGGKFRLDDQASLRIPTRATGVVFADLDNDGDLDLYVGSMPQPKNELRGCSLFRNDGGGEFTDISQGNGACPAAFGGRSVAVLDYDGDGLLDLLVGEDPNTGYNGSQTKSSRLFRNKGGMQFEDASDAAGLGDVAGYGVAAGDVNNDGWPDIFIASTLANVLYLNDGRGRFREASGARQVFAWEDAGGDDMVCGVCFGDVNRDGLLDVVLAQHFKRPWLSPVANRLYLNRGVRDGSPDFEDVTDRVGLTPLGMKSPHVEIQDFDNDGWPDIYFSVVKFKDGRPYPIIFRHQGMSDGLPRFGQNAWSVNDFPTDEDRSEGRTGAFFDKLVREKKIMYTAPGPSGDFNNDGRLDLFLPNWWVESRSLLLENQTPGGNWLRVRVEGSDGVNRMGIGSRIKIFKVGGLGEPAGLLGCREISVGYGYASGQPAYAHFGLGEHRKVDVEVILPHGKGTIVRRGVDANELLTVTK